jgi:Domain of unknown function (DUF4272)
METEEDFSPTPPDRNRVAARALVLAAVSCRGMIEKDVGRPGADELRRSVITWLDTVGAANELEPAEYTLLSTPLGKLDRRTKIDASWQSEGMVVLAWVLGCAEPPTLFQQCDAIDVAHRMGFLGDRRKTPLECARLRDSAEIEQWADTYLTLHWRLRQFSSAPEPIDFVMYVSDCTWGPLRLDGLEIIDRDLAIEGERIDKLAEQRFRESLSITQERHRAFNWLLGFEPLYSRVTTDT